ncbi:alpha/beta hydrolase [Mesobacillus harenae]|uniref:alpha/beta hydrolase n=1 Tax=Mesobacillus harenae TaxID=2213203 RepID=UPI001580DA7D|nr:alpha/beta hydrolase [Mesobacillus harenae]
MKKSFLAFSLGAALIFTASAGSAAPPASKATGQKAQNQSTIPYYVDESKLPFESLEGYKTDRYWGVHKGAGYRIEVPKNWNGELVLYAHGYNGTGLELTFANGPAKIREHLLKNGYAWAASTYSTNGYDVAQGVKDTHALGSLFNGKVGKPSRTYVTGHSMGGHITAVLAEQYSNSYDGALPMCGVTGDTELFDFFTDFNLVAQSLAGIAKDDQKSISDGEYITETVPLIKSKLGIDGTLTAEGERLKAVTMNLTGGDRPLFDTAFNTWKNFLLGQLTINNRYGVAAGNVVNTTDSVYQFDGDMSSISLEEQALNDAVLRVTSDPQTKQQGLTGIPKVNGTHKIPMVSLHNIGDLFVPFHMQQLHAKRAAANGNEDLLVTRVTRAVGHCGFTPKEETEGFDALVKWVEEGKKPEGDDILNPEAVAEDTFGTKFTRR